MIKRAMHTKTVRATVSTLALFLVMLVAQPITTARADLTLMPIRTVFSGHDHMKSLVVVNSGTKAATFRLSFYYQRQVLDGGYAAQGDKPLDPKYDVAKMISYSPRQITLAPNATQVIRMSLRKPADLPDGEYRVHLKLERISGGSIQSGIPIAKGATATMTINIGFSVPIIVRQGKYDATASIADPQLIAPKNRNPAELKFFLDRKGKFSTLGKVEVYWTPKGGTEKQVGLLNDVNVYAETARRSVEVPLTENNISGGTFRIVYEGDDADKDIKFDEKTFPVGG